MKISTFSILFLALIISLPAFSNSRANWKPVVDNDPLDSLITVSVYDVSADSIEAYVQHLEDFGTRFMLDENRRDIAVWLRDKFEVLGCEARLDSFETTVQWPFWSGTNYTTWQYNVEATIEGSTTPDQVYLMGAHYDAILNSGDPFVSAPGADDNASGVAAMLETARVMQLNEYQPESTIKFVAFAAEELGLIGSEDYAQKAQSNGTNIVMMINNDMIANAPLSSTDATLAFYPNAGTVTNTAIEIAGTYTDLNLTLDNTYMQYSDSYSFYEAGFPPVFFAESEFSPYYHTTNDLTIHCNFVYCAEMTKLSLAMLISENGYTTAPPPAAVSEVPNSLLKLRIFPNPVHNEARIRYTLPYPGNVDFTIYNATGAAVSTLASGFQQQGNHQIVFDASALPVGVYFAVLETTNTTETVRIVVNH